MQLVMRMSKQLLRRFNEEGQKEYRKAVNKIRNNQVSISAALTPIIDNDSLTEIVDPKVPVAAKDFDTRCDLAIYINEIVAQTDLSVAVLREDLGLWNWLAAFYFDKIVNYKKDGTPIVGASERYIAVTYRDAYRRYYRHQIAGAWVVYKIHEDRPELAEFLLDGEPYLHTELFEQLASTNEIIVNPGLLSAVRRLYWDEETKSRKRGHADKALHTGSVRRIPPVFDQFKLTWEFSWMPVDEILELLPAEFDRFKK